MKIYSLGSMNIDYVYSVDHFVIGGETLSSTDMNTFPGGKGLNQSVASSRAGASVLHGGVLGTGGDFLRDVLSSSGVNTDLIKSVSSPSGHAIIQVDKSGQNCILLHSGSNGLITKEYIEEFLKGAEEGDILLLQNEISGLKEAFEVAKKKGLSIAFNPSPFNEKVLDLPLDEVKWFFVNEIEGAEIAGETDPSLIAERFSEKYPESVLILTLGKQGSLYKDKDESFTQPIFEVKAADTTAAGDTFTGFFLASVCDGKTPREAMKIASCASSITVSREGASVSIPTISEVLEKLKTAL